MHILLVAGKSVQRYLGVIEEHAGKGHSVAHRNAALVLRHGARIKQCWVKIFLCVHLTVFTHALQLKDLQMKSSCFGQQADQSLKALSSIDLDQTSVWTVLLDMSPVIMWPFNSSAILTLNSLRPPIGLKCSNPQGVGT